MLARFHWLVLAAAMLTGACTNYTMRQGMLGTCATAKTADDRIKYCDIALQQDLWDYDLGLAHNERGLGYLEKKEYDLAIADFDKAIQYRGYEGVPYVNRGDAYLQKKEFDRAIEDYNRALAKVPLSPATYSRRGLAYLWKRDARSALADFDKAVELTGNASAGALVLRAMAHFALRDYPSATADLRKVQDLKPASIAAEDALCTTLAYEGRTYEALAHCARAAKGETESDGPPFAQGYARLRNGDWKGALADCDETARRSPVPAPALYCSAYAHERLGDTAAAQSGYAAARASDAKVDEAMQRLGIVPGQSEIRPES